MHKQSHLESRPKLSIEWFGQLKPDTTEYNRRLASILSSAATLEILYDILSRRKEKLLRPTRETYTTPGWQYLLAHDNGQLEEINFILALLKPLFVKD